jgi:hypothetical protein
MSRHDAIERLEISMQIANRTKCHAPGAFAPAGGGTSRSFLSQTKSFLL